MTHAQIYEWVDENGEKQFSDQRPRDNVNAVQKTYDIHNIDEGLPAPIVVDSDRRQRQALDQLARERNLDKACKKAKDHLTMLSGRVTYTDEKGDDVFVSEKDRQQQAIDLQAAINRHCQ